MIKYGNANHEKKIDKDGKTIVSNVPITKDMEKTAQDGKKKKAKGVQQEVINANDRESE